MQSKTVRLKIKFADHVSLDDVEKSIASGFGGFGDVTPDADPRTIFLVGPHWPFSVEVVLAQLDAFQRDGILTWERAA